MIDLTALKAVARTEAMAVRVVAHRSATGAPRIAAGHVLQAIAGLRGVSIVSGYLPIRHEIDALPAMRALIGLGFRVAVPVIVGRGQPLVFREWTPGATTELGGFGVHVPVAGETVEPDVLLVPMLAFDRRGHRLGYGGGFYDRTIADLRGRRSVTAIGFAFAAQEVPEVPVSPQDTRLDSVVTERELVRTA